LEDETSYSPHHDHGTIEDHETNPDQESAQDQETSQDQESGQEPVTQDGCGELATMTDMDSQVLTEAAPVDFAEPAEPAALQFEPEPVPAVEIRAAEPAPLVASASGGAAGDGAAGDSARELLGLPLQFLNQLLQRIGSAKLDSLADLIPAARLVGIALLAGVALKLTGATLGAINDVPMLGGLLELTGLVAMLNFLARNALKQQKRAELLGRIRKLKQDFLG
jgi:hypothetical protein